DVAEVIVYNAALSDADRLAVQGYLSNKWLAASSPSSVNSASFVVAKANSSSVVASSLNPSGFGDSVAFTNTVSGVPRPAGGVQFATNGVAWGTTVPLNSGLAVSAAIVTLPRGTNTITAQYAGDADFIGITNSLQQVVTNPLPVAVTDNFTRGPGVSM